MYSMKCTVVDYARFFIGDGKDARIFERFCDYEVNGQKGWGISEWDYRSEVSYNRLQSWVVYMGNVFKGMKYWDNICRHHLEVENFKLFSL